MYVALRIVCQLPLPPQDRVDPLVERRLACDVENRLVHEVVLLRRLKGLAQQLSVEGEVAARLCHVEIGDSYSTHVCLIQYAPVAKIWETHPTHDGSRPELLHQRLVESSQLRVVVFQLIQRVLVVLIRLRNVVVPVNLAWINLILGLLKYRDPFVRDLVVRRNVRVSRFPSVLGLGYLVSQLLLLVLFEAELSEELLVLLTQYHLGF